MSASRQSDRGGAAEQAQKRTERESPRHRGQEDMPAGRFVFRSLSLRNKRTDIYWEVQAEGGEGGRARREAGPTARSRREDQDECGRGIRSARECEIARARHMERRAEGAATESRERDGDSEKPCVRGEATARERRARPAHTCLRHSCAARRTPRRGASPASPAASTTRRGGPSGRPTSGGGASRAPPSRSSGARGRPKTTKRQKTG